jgi:hypothetical protein
MRLSRPARRDVMQGSGRKNCRAPFGGSSLLRPQLLAPPFELAGEALRYLGDWGVSTTLPRADIAAAPAYSPGAGSHSSPVCRAHQYSGSAGQSNPRPVGGMANPAWRRAARPPFGGLA